MTTDFLQIIEQTDEEKLEMYRKNCTFDELARMHIELLKHIPDPKLYSIEEGTTNAQNNP